MRDWVCLALSVGSGCLTPNDAYLGSQPDSATSSAGATDTDVPGPTLDDPTSADAMVTTDPDTAGSGETADGGTEIPPPEDWWDQSFPYRRHVVFNDWFGDPLGFLPVRIDVGALSPGNPAGKVKFVTEGFEPLIHSVELWGTDQALAWVAVPVPLGGDPPSIWMYYGAREVPDPLDFGPFDFASSYVGVWHLFDEQDATLSGFDLENAIDAVDGVIGTAADMTGTSGLVVPSDMTLVDLWFAGFTFSAWVRIDDLPSGSVLYSKQAAADDAGLEFCIDPSGSLVIRRTFRVGEAAVELSSLAQIPPSEWVHITVVYSDDQYAMYFNGDFVPVSGQLVAPVNPASDIGAQIYFGARSYDGAGTGFAGSLDEIRLTPGPQLPGWVTAAYRAQLADFAALGSVEMFDDG